MTRRRLHFAWYRRHVRMFTRLSRAQRRKRFPERGYLG